MAQAISPHARRRFWSLREFNHRRRLQGEADREQAPILMSDPVEITVILREPPMPAQIRLKQANSRFRPGPAGRRQMPNSRRPAKDRR